jgi:hypothetical protein
MHGWQEQAEELPLEARIKARLTYELAADRTAGQPVEITAAALRAVATAEGLDSRHPWIDAAAADIAARAPESTS